MSCELLPPPDSLTSLLGIHVFHHILALPSPPPSSPLLPSPSSPTIFFPLCYPLFDVMQCILNYIPPAIRSLALLTCSYWNHTIRYHPILFLPHSFFSSLLSSFNLFLFYLQKSKWVHTFEYSTTSPTCSSLWIFMYAFYIFYLPSFPRLPFPSSSSFLRSCLPFLSSSSL